MYQSNQAMSTESENHAHTHFLQRIGSLPIVETAIGQLANIYQHTKDSNRYMKYTLETTEAGAKTVAQLTVPIVVNKLERPIGVLNLVACRQLNKLEEKCPIITKPTEEVVQETKRVYDVTLKPMVDTVSGVTKTSLGKVGAAKQYTVDTISATKQYTVDTVTSVKDYTVNIVSGVKSYTYNTVAASATYSKNKLDGALETSTGQTIISKFDQLLEKTEQTVDYYLPEPKKEGVDKSLEALEIRGQETTVCPADGPKPTGLTFGKLVNMSNKIRRRMYAKSLRNLQHVQRRSKETLDRLNFTIEYAKSNIDGAKNRSSFVKTKFLEVWEEINKEEEDSLEMSNMAAERTEENGEKGSPENGEMQVSDSTLEKRAIALAGNLMGKLKSTLNTMMNTGAFLPGALQSQISGAKSFTENLSDSFANAKTLNGITTTLLTQTRTQVLHLQETLTTYSIYIHNNYLSSWVDKSSPEGDEVPSEDDNEKDVEIETVLSTGPAPVVSDHVIQPSKDKFQVTSPLVVVEKYEEQKEWTNLMRVDEVPTEDNDNENDVESETVSSTGPLPVVSKPVVELSTDEVRVPSPAVVEEKSEEQNEWTHLMSSWIDFDYDLGEVASEDTISDDEITNHF